MAAITIPAPATATAKDLGQLFGPASERTEIDAFTWRLATLSRDDVVSLACAYRSWCPVLSAALDHVPAAAVARLRNRTCGLRAAVAAAARDVGDEDLEDAKMAVWLYALAEATEDASDAVVALLRAPWEAAILPRLEA